MVSGAIHCEIYTEFKGVLEGRAQGISRGLRLYSTVDPNFSHNSYTYIINGWHCEIIGSYLQQHHQPGRPNLRGGLGTQFSDHAQRAKKASAKGRSPPQDPEVGPHSGSYLLVIVKVCSNFTWTSPSSIYGDQDIWWHLLGVSDCSAHS